MAHDVLADLDTLTRAGHLRNVGLTFSAHKDPAKRTCTLKGDTSRRTVTVVAGNLTRAAECLVEMTEQDMALDELVTDRPLLSADRDTREPEAAQ